MSRMTPHLRRLMGLCLLAASFGLLEVAAIHAAEDQGKKVEPPTLLWKSYPLDQPPSTTDRAGAQSPKRPVPAQTSAQQDKFLTFLGSFILLVAAAAIVVKGRAVPIRRSRARQTPDRGLTPRPAHRTSVKWSPWRRRRQQLREVVPEVGEPRAPTLQSPACQSAAHLLEGLQLKPSSPPKPEPMPEVAAISLEEARPIQSPEPVQRQPANEVHLREADGPLSEEGETDAGRTLERQLELELWTRIADVDLMPVLGPEPHTRKEFPAH